MIDKAILCVDDEIIILLAIIQELKSAFGTNFIYERALSGEEALELIDELAQEGVRVILIISDWLLPGIKGDELLELVREKYPDIKAIMITGQADEKAVNRVNKNSSVLAVLRKPWNNKELRTIVTNLLIN